MGERKLGNKLVRMGVCAQRVDKEGYLSIKDAGVLVGGWRKCVIDMHILILFNV